MFVQKDVSLRYFVENYIKLDSIFVTFSIRIIFAPKSFRILPVYHIAPEMEDDH